MKIEYAFVTSATARFTRRPRHPERLPITQSETLPGWKVRYGNLLARSQLLPLPRGKGLPRHLEQLAVYVFLSPLVDREQTIDRYWEVTVASEDCFQL